MERKKNVTAINLVENSHHDLGWHKGSYDAEAAFTFDEINTALDMMQTDPDFTWTHECCGYLYAYLQKFPERKEELHKRILEGRFDIGAGYAMPYTSFVTSEMLARLFIYGKKWAEKEFPGCCANVYYNTDVPGLGAQMPQLMKKADVRYLYASRSWNFEGIKRNAYKLFRSPDGSTTRTFFMNHYGNGMLPENPVDKYPYMEERIEEHADSMEKSSIGGALLMLYSMDCMMPVDFRERFQAWNTYAEEHGLPKMKYSTMQAALNDVFTETADLSGEVLSGEWPSKWFYENAASDHDTFLQQREAERFLRTTETLAVLRAIATGSFAAYPAKEIEEAWRAVDHSCHGYAPEGSIQDFKRVYQKALDISKTIYEENLTWLAQAVRTDAAKGDVSFVVYNNLSWVRNDFLVMDKPDGVGDCFRIVDADGKEAAYQVRDDGKLLVEVRDIPSMGYKVYYIRKGEQPAVSGEKYTVGGAWDKAFANAYYTVTPVVTGGALASVLDRENGDKSLFLNDKFQIGELYDFQYDGLGAGEQLNMWQPHDGVSQIGCFAPWTCVESGPVCTVFETRAEKTSRGPAVMRFTMYENIKRADFDLLLDMDDADARQLRLMFPMNTAPMFGDDRKVDASRVRVSYEVPFGSVRIGDEMLSAFSDFNKNEGDPNNVGGGGSDPKDFTENSGVRPREVQNWVEAADLVNDTSVTISTYNKGWDYQDATPAPCKTPVLQPVLLSTSKSCHWLYGHWVQPGTHTFRYALTSGTAASVQGHKMAVGVNNPLAAVVQEKPGTILPETDTGITVNRDNVVLSAVKKAEDDDKHIVLRWYEAEGSDENKDVAVHLSGARAVDVQKVNLLERPEESDAYRCSCCGCVTGPVAPWSIETAMVSVDEIK